MVNKVRACGGVVILLAALAPGCAEKPAAKADRTTVQAEAEVRERFADLQAVAKKRDLDRLWGMLSGKSQAAAEKEAEALRAAHEKAAPDERARLEKFTGLTAEQLAKLTGKGFLQTARFLHKSGEMGESTVERVTASGDSATVYFTEQDGDKEKMVFLREATSGRRGWRCRSRRSPEPRPRLTPLLQYLTHPFTERLW
jgi:hypothetical protein